jgi:glycosyltransferase involved in cell wall biosynthesis
MDNPEFSIIIPCYNHSHFLEDCFNSIFGQRAESWEAILVNDGSIDYTKEIGLGLSVKDSRIKYIEQENRGLSAARNAGMSLAKGKFLLFLDADDWLESTCLMTYLNRMRTYPEFDLFRCSYSYWDRPKGRKYHSHILNSGIGELVPDILTQNIGPCHSILIRRSFAEKVGGFDSSLNSCEDWDYWIRAGKMGAKMISIPDCLVAYRYVPKSMSRNPKVMYESLTEVSRRASKVDFRIPNESKYNREISLDYASIQKKHLILLLGVMLHQGYEKEAQEWYLEEALKWNWKIEDKDWKSLSSYLSWGYFFEKDEVDFLTQEFKSKLSSFFQSLNYELSDSIRLARMVMEPQLKKRNHQLFGKSIGGLKNKLGWY